MRKSEQMNRCPQCGSKAFVKRDVVDGFDFGWSVGCPRYKQNDGLHNRQMAFHYLSSEEEAIEKWDKESEQHG